jgi:hypothetical protein
MLANGFDCCTQRPSRPAPKVKAAREWILAGAARKTAASVNLVYIWPMITYP